MSEWWSCPACGGRVCLTDERDEEPMREWEAAILHDCPPLPANVVWLRPSD
jgi:hypothetical protein